jgi:hypothetical protein
MTALTRLSRLFKSAALLPLFLCVAAQAKGADAAGDFASTEQLRQSRLDWWREAKYGLFIHWGAYAVPGHDAWYMSPEYWQPVSPLERFIRGDYATPEGFIPGPPPEGEDWESCLTINGSWGYKPEGEKIKPPAEVVLNITQKRDHIAVEMPDITPDPIATVLCVELK